MRIFTLLAAMFFTLQALAQDQPGYYINADGQRTEGFFKTSDFYNPNTLEFRKVDEADFIPLATDNLTEYGIADEFKFRKFSIDNRTIFLNTLVEGQATLYSHRSERYTVYYYTVTNKYAQPVMLLHTPSRGSEARKPENNAFREQLKQDVACPENMVNFDRLQYNERDLTDVFTRYNTCSGATQVVYENSSARTNRMYFTLFAGLFNNNFSLENMSAPYNDDNSLSAGLGVEAAYCFPNNYLEVFSRLEFENFSTTIQKDFPEPIGYRTHYIDINSTFINLFVGPRMYIKVNSSSRIFADASFGFSVPFGEMNESWVNTEGTVVTNESRKEYDLDTAVCGNFGIGYVYNNKFGVVLRYETDREIFSSTNTGYTGKLKRIGINLRYTFN